jgi:cytoskeletal protein RodZ
MFTTEMVTKLLISSGSNLARFVCVEVGQQLFEARQRHGLTLEDIAQSTKIPVSLLRAIECDDAARLPQGFFTRAFVRAYANEVGINADALLDAADLGDVEEVTVAPPAAQVPIHQPFSSRSLFVVLALAGCAVYYLGFASQATRADILSVTVAQPAQLPKPVTFAPPPCVTVEPPATPIRTIQRTVAITPSTKTDSPLQIETASAVEPSPSISDAVLPEVDPAPASPVEQF